LSIVSRLKRLWSAAEHAPLPDSAITREHIIWAYRLLLDREPESEEVITAGLANWHHTKGLRTALVTSPEYRLNNADMPYIDQSCVVIKELDNGTRLFLDLGDSMIGLSILRGIYEPDETAFVQQAVQPGQNVLDIGANIGYFTLMMANQVGPQGYVHAFEPLNLNADLLQRSIIENHFEQRISLDQVAVGDAPGNVKILYLTNRVNSGGVRVYPSGTPPEGHELRDVPMIMLDQTPLKRPIHFIKIDIEGAEPLALRGAQELLRVDQPVILSELHADLLDVVTGVSPTQFIASMQEHGYSCHVLHDGRLSEQVTTLDHSRVWSVVFLPAGHPQASAA